tara:strand:+ start:913 stop:1155 length:243 start_codon:yes stop_codon:yes gene_type:complete
MAKIIVRRWAKEYLADNSPATTEDIANYIERRSTIGVRSIRSLGAILSSTPGIEKVGQILVTKCSGTCYVNRWQLVGETK